MLATDEDYDWAERVMTRHSMNNNDRISYKEATAVLTKIAEGVMPNVTEGQVQALLDADADVCLARRRSNNIIKAMRSKDQDDIRSNLLEKATRHCSVEILTLLALNADDIAINQALPVAIARNEAEKATVLLARGADASRLCKEFLNAVDAGSDDMVNCLMRNLKGPCQSCRDNGLIRAATSGQANKTSTLLQKGANVNFNDAAAFRAAIKAGWGDIAAAIVSHKEMRLPADQLDLAVGVAYAKAQYQALRACLRAGAHGPTTNAALVHAVEQGQCELADSLIQYKASVEFQSGAAVVSAVKRGEPKLLRVVLCAKPSLSAMAAAISCIGQLDDIRTAHPIIELLVSAGLRGDAVSETLIRVLDRKLLKGDEHARYGVARLLLDNGKASVDVHSGHSFTLAAAAGWTNILQLLIRCRPSVESLVLVFEPAMRLVDADVRKQIVAMVVDVGHGSTNPSVMERLTATAVAAAAKALHLDTLEDLARSQLSRSAIQAGFAAAISTGAQWTTPSGLKVVQFFLKHGAEGPSVDDAFCTAAICYKRDAIGLLSQSVGPGAVDRALMDVVKHSQDWCSLDDRNIWLLKLLLEWGAHAEPVNLALLSAVRCSTAGMASETILDALLFNDASDVNFRGGDALRVAARGGNVSVLRKLVRSGADKKSMTDAFHEAIISPLGEDIVLRLIEVLAASQDPNRRVDFKEVLPNRRPPIVDCLATHPGSAKLVRRLVELGCDVNAQFVTHLYDFAEPASVLTWALRPLEGESLVSSVAIEELIDVKADVNFAAPLSKATPLILASKYRRGDIVKKLVKANADTYVRDHRERSPLFFASREGDLGAVKVLLKARYRPNDGSLHEAARNLHSDIVSVLIKSTQHDANFPSSRPEHEGRTPLQEMAFLCDGQRRADDIEATIVALEKGKADIFATWRSWNPLFLALHNAQPFTATKALLDTVMWRVIDNDKNVLVEVDPETNVKRFLSPTIYLQRERCSTDNKGYAQTCWQLEQLLRTKNCPDRYYANLGADQPAGAVGMPEHIAKEDKKRRDATDKRAASEYEHQQKMRREREEAQLKKNIDTVSHEAWRQREFEKSVTKVDASNVVHQNQLLQQEQMSTQQQEALAAKNLSIEQAKVRNARAENEALRQQQDLRLGYQQQTGQLRIGQQMAQERVNQQSAQAKLSNEQRSQNLKLGYQQQASQVRIKQQMAQDRANRESAQAKVTAAQRLQKAKAAEDRQKLQHTKDMNEQKTKQQNRDREHQRNMQAAK